MSLNPSQTMPGVAEARGEAGPLPGSAAAAGQARGAGGVLWLGVWLALVIGWLDVAIVAVQKYGLGEFVHRSPHVVWLAPLAYLLLFTPPAAVLALAARRWARLRSVGVGLLLFAGSLSVLLQLGYQRIHSAALVALAVGVAVQGTRLLLAHERRFFTLVRRTVPALALLVVVAGAAVGGLRWGKERAALAGLPAARPGAPNVLLLILDTVRSASLGLYGYERPTTPRLERFAARGVVYDWAISPSSWTLPSHASMFTGREPEELSASWLTPLDAQAPTIAEVLRGRGYDTGGFVANLQYGMAETGLSRGFIRYSDYHLSLGQLFMQSSLGRFFAARRAFRTVVGTDQVLARRSAEQINADFLGWLEGVQGRPFFAFLNYYDAHDPYLPPDEFYRKFAGRDRPNRLSPLRRLTVRERRAGVSAADLRLELDSYDASIAYLDDRIGRLLDELDRRGVLSNTVVVITSDHGEEFGEHGVYYHGHSLYLPALHVPLLVAYPGGPRGVRSATAVSLKDLAPTLAQLAGAGGTTGLGGRSFIRPGELHAAAAPPAPGAPLRSELRKGIRLPEWYPVALGDMTSVVADGLHYIRNGDGREELFDIRRDPWEQQDLAGSPAAAASLQALRALVATRVAGPIPQP